MRVQGISQGLVQCGLEGRLECLRIYLGFGQAYHRIEVAGRCLGTQVEPLALPQLREQIKADLAGRDAARKLLS